MQIPARLGASLARGGGVFADVFVTLFSSSNRKEFPNSPRHISFRTGFGTRRIQNSNIPYSGDWWRSEVNLLLYVCICMYVCIYIYIYIHTYIHTHMRTFCFLCLLGFIFSIDSFRQTCCQTSMPYTPGKHSTPPCWRHPFRQRLSTNSRPHPMCAYIYIYIYIYIYMHYACVYVYIYIYIYTYMLSANERRLRRSRCKKPTGIASKQCASQAGLSSSALLRGGVEDTVDWDTIGSNRYR